MVWRWLEVAVGALFLAGCPAWMPRPVEPSGDDAGPAPLRTLWTAPPAVGVAVRIEARVVTPPTLDGRVYLQDPDEGQGLELLAGGHLEDWPPPSGARVVLTLVYGGPEEAPRAWLRSDADIEVTATGEAPVVLQDPAEPPAAFTLARWPAVSITGPADPTGRARTSLPFVLDGRFGVVPPGPDASGALTGLVTERGAVAMRSAGDFDGVAGRAEPAVHALGEVRAGGVSDGTWVQVAGTRVAPWSTGGRLTAIQADGLGLWIDTEGFGDEAGAVGEGFTFTGELVRRGAVWRLRSWTTPTPLDDPPAVVLAEALDDGALVEVEVAGLGAVASDGSRVAADGTVLDGRFLDLAALPEAATVRAVVDGATDPPRLAVTQVVSAP